MIIIAASLYLPEHIVTMWNRAWFYYAGDETSAAGAAARDQGLASGAKIGMKNGGLGDQWG